MRQTPRVCRYLFNFTIPTSRCNAHSTETYLYPKSFSSARQVIDGDFRLGLAYSPDEMPPQILTLAVGALVEILFALLHSESCG